MRPIEVTVQTSEFRILEKLREKSELHPKGFDFTINTKRLPWLKEVISKIGAAYEEIADEIAWVDEILTDRPITLTEFMSAYMSCRQANTGLNMDVNPAYWRIGTNLGNLVIEDFKTNNIISAMCVSIAPSEDALEQREAKR